MNTVINEGLNNVIELILISLSFAFGIMSIRYLRKFDVHEQEPFGKMAAVTVWGGLVSIVLSLFLYSVLHGQGIRISDGVPFSYFFVGFIEEGAKLAALFLSWGLIRREMDEPTDGLIYMACVALGFSLIENYFYAARNPYTTPLIAIRLIICTPMHIAFSMVMGLTFFRAVRYRGGWNALLWSYLFASVYHALYDIFVSWWFLLPGLYLILRGAYGWMHRLLGYTAAKSPFRMSLAGFVHSCENPTVEAGLECLECGSPAPKPTFERGRIRLQRCDACGTMLCSIPTLMQVIHQFGSTFGRLKMRPVNPQQKNLCVIGEANRIDRRKGIACFRLDEFDAVLERMSREAVARAERRWWGRRAAS